MNRNGNKGFTLIEVVLTISIMSMVMMIVFSMFSMADKPHKIINREYVVQSNVRLASQKLSSLIRKSTATFVYKDVESIFTEDVFGDPGLSSGLVLIDDTFINSSPNKAALEDGFNKYKGWSFITLGSGGRELREFVFHKNPSTGKTHYTMQRILEKQSVGDSDIVYDITYKKKNPYTEDRLIQYTIVGKLDGSESILKPIEIKSEVEALSSLQVVDKGDYTKSAEVLFYRTDERPMGVDAEAAVAMVLDISGSMGRNLDGNTANPSSTSRIAILREKAQELVNKMSSLENIYVNLIPFSNTSNVPSAWSNYKYNGVSKDPTAWKNAKSDKGELNDLISRLNATNGTNVGDGIRRAYYRLNGYSEKNAGKYMILLMDGVPTFGSVHRVAKSDHTFNKDKNTYTPPPTLEHGGNTYFYFSEQDNYILFWYIDTTYTYRRYTTIDFVTSNIEIKDQKLPQYNTSYTAGYYEGPGNVSDEFLSKGYIVEIAKKLSDIKNNNGDKNLKIFAIGFSNVESEREELDFIKNELAKYAEEVSSFEVTNAEELAKVFYDINQIILDDLWAITGPKE